MTYGKCRSCGFWVLDKDPVCPDCGCRFPIKKPSAVFKLVLPAVAVVGLALFYLIVALIPAYHLRMSTFWIVSAVGVVAVFIIGAIIDSALYGRDRFTARNLRTEQENVKERMRNIRDRIEKIHQVRASAHAGKESEKQKSMLALLDNAEKMLDQYRERYEIELWKLEVIRWKNTLEPIAFEWQQADYDRCGRKLEQLQHAIDNAKSIKEKYESSPLASIDEAKKVIANVDEYIEICHKFYEGITARQAKLAINDVTPLDAQLTHGDMLSDQRDQGILLQSRDDVDRFVQAFEGLENEFDRIEADERIQSEG